MVIVEASTVIFEAQAIIKVIMLFPDFRIFFNLNLVCYCYHLVNCYWMLKDLSFSFLLSINYYLEDYFITVA